MERVVKKRRWRKEKEKRIFLSTARWIYRRFFFVGYFIKYGQLRSMKVNHSQLRLIKIN